MQIMIAGATGLIGTRLVNHCLARGNQVIAVGRSSSKIKKSFDDRVEALTWDALTINALKKIDFVINLAGENIGDARWTDARKQAILSSRTETTSRLANLLKEIGKNAPPLFNASAVGIYGLQQELPNDLPPALTEETSIDWSDAPDFLSTVGRAWEQAALPAIHAGVRVVFMRFAVVLAKEGGALPKIAFPFRLMAGGRVGSGEQPFSWIVIDDLINAIDFLMNKPDAEGAYNFVSPACVKQRVLAAEIASTLHRPCWLPMPAAVMRIMLGRQMADELLLAGQHAYPKRLLEAGFHFQYPDLKGALAYVF